MDHGSGGSADGQLRERDVPRDGLREQRPLLGAVLRDVPHARSHRVADGAYPLARERHRAAVCLRDAEDRAAEIRLAGPDHSGETHDLAGLDVERDVRERPIDRQALHCQEDFGARVYRRLLVLVIQMVGPRAPHHHVVELVLSHVARLARSDEPTVLDHEHAIAVVEQFAEPVPDVDDAGPFASLPDDAEEELGLIRLQTRRRLVQQQDRMRRLQEIRESEGLDDLEDLPDRERIRVHRAGDVDPPVLELFEVRPCPSLHLGVVDQPERPESSLVRQEQVLVHRNAGDERELLEHAEDAVAVRVAVAAEADFRPADGDASGIWRRDSRQQVQERGLAGPVLADHAEDLVVADLDVDALEHAVRAVGLPEAHTAQEDVGRGLRTL